MIKNKFKLIVILLFGLMLFRVGFSNKLINNQQSEFIKDHTPSVSLSFGSNTTWSTVDDDRAYGVAMDNKTGALYVVGWTDNTSDGEYDVLLLKYNNYGVLEWNTTWGGAGVDVGLSLVIDESGNIFIAGYTYIGRGGDWADWDVLLLKYNSTGNLQWSSTWGSADNDQASDLVMDSEGGIYVIGSTASYGAGDFDFCLLKFNNTGDLLWNNTWGRIHRDAAYSITIDSEGNLFATGVTYNFSIGHDEVLLMKISSSGEQLWNRTWHYQDYNSNGRDLILDSQNNIYITGRTTTLSSASDILLLKYNENGIYQWAKTWGTPELDEGLAITLDSHDNIFITGYNTVSDDPRLPILKYRPDGQLIWSRIWNTPKTDRGNDILINSNKLYVAGYIKISAESLEEVLLLQYFLTPESFTLTSDADTPHLRDSFNLTWFRSDYASNYSIFMSNSSITDVNHPNVVKVKEGIENNICEIDGLIDGTYYFILMAFNQFGNITSNCISVTLEYYPSITITEPVENQIFGYDSPQFNVILEGLDLDVLWYTIDNGTTNYPILDNGTIDPNQWESMEDGFVHIQFFLNNTHGNTSTNDVYVIKDTISPNLTILNPVDSNLYGKNPPSFDVEITDLHLDQMWYSLNNGKNITFTSNSTFDPTEWDNLPNGTVRIIFYANDTAGNEGSTYIDVFIDIVPPSIVIYSPYHNQLFGSLPPNFMVNINDSNLGSMWYSLEGGGSIPFTVNSTFDLSEWNNLANGTVNINFFANDTAGNIASKTIVVKKDIENPVVSIHNPILNSQFGSISPAYNISVSEGNLDKIWYTLDNGLHNTTISSFVGVINQLEWSTLPEGHITIRFYVNDTVGNVGFEEVIVIKEIAVDPSPDSPAIPGFNVTMIFFLFFVISLLIMSLRKKLKY